MKKRVLSLLMALVMALSLVPVTAFAADDHDGQVHVTVENTTWTKADGAPWEGTLVDEWITLKDDSTMMSCIKSALDKNQLSSTINGSSYGGEYISAINGLAEFDGGSESGWMGTLNDWFTNASFSNFTVKDETLAAGDEIRVMYTKTGYGKDIGSDWSTQSNTALAALSFSGGTLSPAFDESVKSYTLTLSAPGSIKVSATAANKCNQVYLTADGTAYRRSAAVPVESGTVLTVRCGDASETVVPTTYTVTVKVDAPQTPPTLREGVAAAAAENVSVDKPYTVDLSKIFMDVNGDPLTYFVSVNGGAYAPADESYTYTPAAAGTTTLTFKANDGHADSTDTYTVTLTAIDKVTVKFTMQAPYKINSFKVYTYEDGQIGTDDLLSAVKISGKSYTVNLPAGDYWVEGYDSKGNCSGGIKVTVQPAEKAEFRICSVIQVKPGNPGWVEGEDYTVDVVVKDASGAECITKLGINSVADGASFIMVKDGGFKVTITPTEKRVDEGYVPLLEENAKVTLSKSLLLKSMQKGQELVVHAPLGATVSGGYLTGSYNYYFAKSTVVTTETEVVATFVGLPEDKPVFVRVQHPDGVTYWNFADIRNDKKVGDGLCGKMNEAGEVIITAEDLAIGDTSFNKNTIYRFEKNNVDRGDIYLNINTKGYKSMTVGETFGLNVFRNWQAIEGFANAYIALPDMYYQVVDVNGQPSDVVSITPDTYNSSAATMTANKPGTAIVLVTYDSMIHPWGSGTSGTRGEFTAIWPECTGVFVVTVDADGTAIQTNMTIDRMDSQLTAESDKNIDAEHDILFYLGDDGATYSFKPEDGCTVSVARSTVTDKMTFNGFTTDGVSVAADGTVTLSGLTTGRHIVKVEKDGVAAYQVITARQVTLTLQDKDGNELPADTEFNPGDQVTLQFSGLLNPQEKLATAYNFNFKLHYKGADGTYFDSNAGGDYGVYNFSSSPELQCITITIPEDWTGAAYQLTGALSKGGFAGHATHREITYGTGRGPVFDAPSASGVRASLPTVTLRMKTTDLDTIYKTTGDYIEALGTPGVGSIGGEWMTIGLARSGRDVPDGYYDAVLGYVEANIDENGRLDASRSTENSRIILALTAIGRDVTDVGGHNLLSGLDSMEFIENQGINGPVWALIALDSHDYPTSGDVTREKLVQAILDAALESGGWAFAGTTADPDMTAMAIQALAPYYDTDENVRAAVDKALGVLSAAQLPTGGFASWGSENSESCAQVIVALTALGIDPATDSRFVKNGLTILDALASFYVDGGGFRHTASGELDGMATEQGYYALAAYYRFASGQTRLYDMSDVTIQPNTPAAPDQPATPDTPDNSGTAQPTGDTGVTVWVIALTASALCAAVVIGRKKKQA